MEEQRVDTQAGVAPENVVTNQESTSAAPPAPDSKLTEIGGLDAQMNASAGDETKPTPQESEPTPVQTDGLPKPVDAKAESAAKAEALGHEAAHERAANSTAMSSQFAGNPSGGIGTSAQGGLSGSCAGKAASAGVVRVDTEDAIAQMTPPTGRGRGRGRGGGRPRGRARGGGRGGKRKRDEDDKGASDSSDEVTPIATMTKSGRSIQKPTSFVPPPPSPTTNNKKKRHYTNRKNPESAVCKVCLRGTSPASNQVVFCDGCNAPYHQWCHKPPIPNTVTEEVDKEWFCAECESERVVPVPEADVASFVSGDGISAEERQQYFSRLPTGLLVTLLTKATTLKPDLPLFAPDFKTKQQANAATNGNTSTFAPPLQSHRGSVRPSDTVAHPDDDSYGPDTHPPNYPRPGQGLMSTLPPETEDSEFLVEDEDKYGVFTHVYRTDMTAALGQGNGRGPAPAPS